MEKWINALKSDMKIASRTVKKSWKTYFSMFIALFLIQTLFGIVSISESNSRSARRELITEKYDYHIELTNLNDADHYMLVNAEGRMIDPYFEVISFGMENGSHTTGIRFLGDVEDQLGSFLLDFAEIFEHGAVCNRTPLYDFDAGGVGDSVRYMIFLVFLGGVSWILLAILNNIRINHFKFGYGIYMTFGADFKRLSRVIVCEMLYILLLTYLPSMLFSYAVSVIITLSAGGQFYFSVMPILISFFIPLAVMLFAGIFSVRFMASHTPSEVLMAQDNTNHVISPRRTKMLFGVKFPFVPENLSLWRFRKYAVRLVSSATLFALLFTCGMYAVSFYKDTENFPEAQYTVSLAVPDDDFAAELDKVDGVTVLSSGSVSAQLLNSHILVQEDAVLNTDSFEKPSYATSMLALEKVVYRAADAGLPSALTQYYGYDVTGDPDKILTDENSIVLSDSIASTALLDVKVGDTVYVAVSGVRTGHYEEHETYDSDNLLRLRLKYYSFVYKAFTVAAVIHNEPDRSGVCVYLPKDVYADMTGETVTEWSVYMDNEMSDAEFEEADRQVRSLVDKHMTASLRDHETRSYQKLDSSANYAAVYAAMFFLMLMLVPIVWFFSLILFNQKRQGEFDVYRALGAQTSMMKRLLLQDGVFYAVFGGILYAVAAPLCTYGMFSVLTSDKFYIMFLPSYTQKPVYMNPYPETWVYITGILMTVIAAFAACYTSYRLYSKRQSEHISENFSEEE